MGRAVIPLALVIALILLLGVNAFFVLAEFAIVRVRPSRVDELIASGDARAATLAAIQRHLDEHLGVCQVGITLASVALGMVGESAASMILGGPEHGLGRTILAIGASYIVISGSHIVLAELVPKSIAIRIADRAALWCTRPLRLARVVFYPALWLLNTLANRMVRLLRLPRAARDEEHSETELRIILDHYQERGLLSFRRLLYLENVFDLGELVVRDAMRPRAQVRTLDARAPWPGNLALIRASHYSRYPLVREDPDRPVGFIHLKDLVIRGDPAAPDLHALARPLLGTTETTPLEALLGQMQRRRIHAALVRDAAGRWTGFVTLEDIIEELVGTIRDEFEDEEPVRLADILTPAHIHLGVEADNPVAAVRAAIARMPADLLPLPADQIVAAVDERERTAGTYLGHGVGMPHARVPGLGRPFLLILRSDRGIPSKGTAERAYLLFVLLTPAGQPRIHQRLQSVIATLLHESEYVNERLRTAATPGEVLDVIRAGEQASLD
ncbi:MAG TPA: CNNM domain-containing protein [Polyangia bacterium]